MEESSQPNSFSLDVFLKRSWPYLVAGAVFILVVIIGLLRFAISTKDAPKDTQSTPVAVAASSTTLTSLVPRRLDGVLVSAEEAALQPYAVMVENSPDARPLSGPAKANLVIEAPVEGGITRFMLVFDATTTVDQIGPVRSARPYYVEFADALKAVYAHVGGSPEALVNIKSFPGFRNLDQFFAAKFFWRSSKRFAPHNAYTRTDLLRQSAQENRWVSGAFTSWKYLPDVVTTTNAGDVANVLIPYGGSFTVSWSYDSSTGLYTRSQAGSIQRDADGTVVAVPNVLVLLSDEKVMDAEGRLRVRTTGSGKAVLFRDGLRQEIVWRRKTGAWLTFETVDGNDVLFKPGSTWMSIVTSPAMFPGSSDAPASSTGSTATDI